MTEKEQKIKEVYQKLGFIWSKIEDIVTEDGVLILNNPELKYSLEGYENLISDKDHFVSFGNSGLKLQPSCLKGIYNNNGWIRIESEEDLPKERGAFWTFFEGERVTMNTFNTFDDIEFTFDNEKVTHYQPIVKPEPPIY